MGTFTAPIKNKSKIPVSDTCKSFSQINFLKSVDHVSDYDIKRVFLLGSVNIGSQLTN